MRRDRFGIAATPRKRISHPEEQPASTAISPKNTTARILDIAHCASAMLAHAAAMAARVLVAAEVRPRRPPGW